MRVFLKNGQNGIYDRLRWDDKLKWGATALFVRFWIILCILLYTHAVYQNIPSLHIKTKSVRITDRTAINIAFWRATLYASCTSTQWLSVPLHIPPLVTRNKDQCKKDFALIQKPTPTSSSVLTLQPVNSTLRHGVVDQQPITTTNPPRSGASTSQQHSLSSFAYSALPSPTSTLLFLIKSTCTKHLSSSWPATLFYNPYLLALRHTSHSLLGVTIPALFHGSPATKTTILSSTFWYKCGHDFKQSTTPRSTAATSPATRTSSPTRSPASSRLSIIRQSRPVYLIWRPTSTCRPGGRVCSTVLHCSTQPSDTAWQTAAASLTVKDKTLW